MCYCPGQVQLIVLVWHRTCSCPSQVHKVRYKMYWPGIHCIVLMRHRTCYCSGPEHNVLFWSSIQCTVLWGTQHVTILVKNTTYCPGQVHRSCTRCTVLARYAGHADNILSWSGMQLMQTTYCPGQVCRSCRQHTVLVRYAGHADNILSWPGTHVIVPVRYAKYCPDS